jgi:hypothetical protein
MQHLIAMSDFSLSQPRENAYTGKSDSRNFSGKPLIFGVA